MTDWTIMVYISADDVLANFAIDSLNQLRRAAGNGINVMAQFDANDKQGARRFRFDGLDDSNVPLRDIAAGSVSPVNMADPDTLTGFIDWASRSPEASEAKHYLLVLWGHGTELLLDQDPVTNRPRYLTPANLKQALAGTKLVTEGKKIDVIGLDACSMSMVELASELKGCVEFMVASQEEVPDASFPYEQLLLLLKGHDRDDVEGICRMIPRVYQQAFRDYIATPGTGMKEVTLSSLRLAQMDTITEPLRRLSEALRLTTTDSELGDAIVVARQSTRDFVLGLFVDLYDFCEKLAAGLVDKPLVDEATNVVLTSACHEIRDAINVGTCVIENQAGVNAKDCHGVSIYFPYSVQRTENEQSRALLGDEQTGVVNVPLLVKGGTNILRKARSGRIDELEADFKHLHGFRKIGWSAFIAHGWSVVLAQKFPRDLDLHYSAQQCALNLLSLCEERKPRMLPDAPEERTRLVRKPEFQEQPRAS